MSHYVFLYKISKFNDFYFFNIFKNMKYKILIFFYINHIYKVLTQKVINLIKNKILNNKKYLIYKKF